MMDLNYTIPVEIIAIRPISLLVIIRIIIWNNNRNFVFYYKNYFIDTPGILMWFIRLEKDF